MPTRQSGLVLGEEAGDGDGLELLDVPGAGVVPVVGEAVPAGALLAGLDGRMLPGALPVACEPWPAARLACGFPVAPLPGAGPPPSATVTMIVVPGGTRAWGATAMTVPAVRCRPRTGCGSSAGAPAASATRGRVAAPQGWPAPAPRTPTAPVPLRPTGPTRRRPQGQPPGCRRTGRWPPRALSPPARPRRRRPARRWHRAAGRAACPGRLPVPASGAGQAGRAGGAGRAGRAGRALPATGGRQAVRAFRRARRRGRSGSGTRRGTQARAAVAGSWRLLSAVTVVSAGADGRGSRRGGRGMPRSGTRTAG